jgi:hypothetical protein
MGSYLRAQDIVQKLEAEGVRATTDPSAFSAPGILVTPPNLVMDLNCGVTASWTLVAIAPAAQGADRSSWQELDALVDAAQAVLDVESADLVAYVLNGTSYPAYLMLFDEGI